MSQSPHSKSDWSVEETHVDNGPARELDALYEASQPTTEDDFLEATNLGLGNYSSSWIWQQVDEFKDHIFAEAAMGEAIFRLAIHSCKWSLGEEAVRKSPTSDPVEYVHEHDGIDYQLPPDSRREAIMTIGSYRWRALGKMQFSEDEWEQAGLEDRQAATAQMQLQELDHRVNNAHEWTTPQGRMISVRHEASRSLGARLMDNLFGRVREIKKPDDDDDDLDDGGIL